MELNEVLQLIDRGNEKIIVEIKGLKEHIDVKNESFQKELTSIKEEMKIKDAEHTKSIDCINIRIDKIENATGNGFVSFFKELGKVLLKAVVIFVLIVAIAAVFPQLTTILSTLIK